MALTATLQQVVIERGNFEKKQIRLLVDYYRIRRKISFPLPLDQFYVLELPTKISFGYPWSIWMIWRLEERFHSLYNAYQLNGDQECGKILIHELEVFASWTTYNQLKQKPDLSTGHCGRLLYKAINEWKGLPNTLIEKLKKACKQLVDENFSKVIEYYKDVTDVKSILSSPSPKDNLHNIGFIGALGTALAAYCNKDDRYLTVLEKLKVIVLALVEYSKEKGYSEGLAYDGYMFDFLLDAMHLYSKEDQKAMLDNEIIHGIMDQVIHSSVSGDVSVRAELGDVESKEMTFDIVALIKFQKFFKTESFGWYVHELKESSLRSDGIGQLANITFVKGEAPKSKVLKLRASVALRSGWSNDDITVIVSASNSKAGHIQLDSGSVVIGTKGHWLINDPGYQQYMDTSEREYTLGINAHNYPLVNQVGFASKNVKIVSIKEDVEKSITLDLTGCYQEGQVSNVTRKIWILDKNRVAIRDTIEGNKIETVQYAWHGHPNGYTYVNDWGLSQCDDAILWFRGIGISFSPSCLTRLRGSRGSMSFTKFLPKPNAPIWWVFATDEASIKSPVISQKGELIWGKNQLS